MDSGGCQADHVGGSAGAGLNIRGEVFHASLRSQIADGKCAERTWRRWSGFTKGSIDFEETSFPEPDGIS